MKIMWHFYESYLHGMLQNCGHGKLAFLEQRAMRAMETLRGESIGGYEKPFVLVTSPEPSRMQKQACILGSYSILHSNFRDRKVHCMFLELVTRLGTVAVAATFYDLRHRRRQRKPLSQIDWPNCLHCVSYAF